MIKKIAFVGYPLHDREAAKRFWGELLGLAHIEDYDQWSEFDAPDGKTVALDGYGHGDDGAYVALETDDIEQEVARLRQAGVTIRKDVWDNEVCKMALIEDPEGRPVMLHQIAPDRR